MRIAVLCPTRGRPQNLLRMLESCYRTARKNVKVFYYADTDDPLLKEYNEIQKIAETTMMYGPSFDYGLKLHLLARAVSGADIMVMGADDMVFGTKGWDARLREEVSRFPDRICAVSHNCGIGKRNIETLETKECHPHPAVTREWFEALGYISPLYYRHFCPDRYVQRTAEELGRWVVMRDVLIEHRRAGHMKGVEKDETYERVRYQDKMTATDEISWKHSQRQRAADIELLRSKMDV